MNKFVFSVTDDTQKYCDEVVRLLIKYGCKNKHDAVLLVNMFWSDETIFSDCDLRLHEPPYFWAMCIIHDPTLGLNHPSWWKDPKYWPPPPEDA